VAENVALIEAVFARLARTPLKRAPCVVLAAGWPRLRPHRLHPGPANPLAALSAFRAFTAGIQARCEAPPVVQELQAIGAYRLFDR
jgi:hypothetical protein